MDEKCKNCPKSGSCGWPWEPCEKREAQTEIESAE